MKRKNLVICLIVSCLALAIVAETGDFVPVSDHNLNSCTVTHHHTSNVWYVGDTIFDYTANEQAEIVAGHSALREVLDLQIGLNATGQIILSWNQIPNATGYNVYRADTPEALDSPLWQLLASLPTGTSTHLLDTTTASAFFHLTWDTDQPPVPENFVLVEGGTFNPLDISGNPTDYNVTLSTFYIGKYEVTQAEYEAVMNGNPSYHSGHPNRPVENVTWFDAIEYCNRRSIMEDLDPCYSFDDCGTNPDNWPAGWDDTIVGFPFTNHLLVACNWGLDGYRLPTEMEWKFAAWGGNLSQGYTYSGSSNIDSVAWYYLNSALPGYTQTISHDVGTKAPNEIMTYDMSGNVWEWLWDIWDWLSYPTGSYTDPTGPASGTIRHYHGGSFSSDESGCRVAYRQGGMPHCYAENWGFRVCRRIP